MKKPLIIAIIILLIIIIGIISYFIYAGQEDNDIANSCTELGCSNDAVYVGSINSDKYYECDCYYSDRILPENIICFTDDADAENKGYVKSEC